MATDVCCTVTRSLSFRFCSLNDGHKSLKEGSETLRLKPEVFGGQGRKCTM